MEDKMGANPLFAEPVVDIRIRIAEELRKRGYSPATVAGQYLEHVSKSNSNVLGILAESKNMRSEIVRLFLGETPRDFIGELTYGESWVLNFFGASNQKRATILAHELSEVFGEMIRPVLAKEAYYKELKGGSD